MGHSLIRSLIGSHHSLVRLPRLLALLARSAAVTRSLARSLTPELVGQWNMFVQFLRCPESLCYDGVSSNVVRESEWSNADCRPAFALSLAHFLPCLLLSLLTLRLVCSLACSSVMALLTCLLCSGHLPFFAQYINCLQMICARLKMYCNV